MLLTHCSRLVTGLGAKQLGFLCGQAASSQFSVQVKSSLGKQKISCPIIPTVLRVPQRSMVTHIDRIPYSEDFFIRQFFDRSSCGYTYLLADAHTREGIIIDPVISKMEREIELIKELQINLIYALKTHFDASADHCFERLKTFIPTCKSIVSVTSGAAGDIPVRHGDVIEFGRHKLEVRSTPGHTSGCVTYISHEQGIVFTGDTLLIRGCGRTDPPHGDPETLFYSIFNQIFSLPDTFRVYPGRDYNGRTITTIGEEKLFNPRLSGGKDQFIHIMKTLYTPPSKGDGGAPGADHGLYNVKWI